MTIPTTPSHWLSLSRSFLDLGTSSYISIFIHNIHLHLYVSTFRELHPFTLFYLTMAVPRWVPLRLLYMILIHVLMCSDSHMCTGLSPSSEGMGNQDEPTKMDLIEES